MFLSVVITSFNRIDVLVNAIESVTTQKHSTDQSLEIIIVDDASSDGTSTYLLEKYDREIKDGNIIVKALEKNVGVSGAKNAGYEIAKGQWVIFLDSDDIFIDGIMPKLKEALIKYHHHPLIFFRCIDQNGEFVGQHFEDDKILDIYEYVKYTSYGEAIAAINKSMVKRSPYISSLRGYEGLGCCRIIRDFGSAILSDLAIRIYIQDRDDRLSATKGFMKRLPLLARGHHLWLKEFKMYMPYKLRFSYRVKAIIYAIVGFLYNLARGK
ncbi:glycosyltransferase family 2 protein [Thiotrichales bacterium 19S3-7]|nr:glycosyltransferase family 2 protein [Thiotrichales bacterium 19S3-7]MCF6800684.1 glycosyltransferase family 2 protein [Thiotrichales bacterium 19S3-11]